MAADRVVIVAVSRLVRHKGYGELLAAMERVPGAELWVVGERLASDRGADLAAALAARPRRAGCAGWATARDVPALLAAADIFCLPSHFEGLPMSVIEAMLTGLPVVSTAIRGPREQVVDGRPGLLVPPFAGGPLAAALARLAADAGLRRAMGDAGRARARSRYDEAAVLARVVGLLEGVGEGSGYGA